jgi:ribosomal protein S18 acetylase RimI-like enzyme
MDYQLVAATEDDRQWLEQLRRSVYRDLFFATWGNWDEARHLRHCSECWDQGNIFCVEVGGVRVGMIQLFDGPDAIEVGEIQISPSYQGRGIGSMLLRDTVRSAGQPEEGLAIYRLKELSSVLALPTIGL